ncbi:esterase-like activity of phytase family protein [Staphylococcus equorum]|uniref:Esterase-like activity of phytase family protein n=1 Tax=Staphylococcus equorum TaxID=246432 RepID=A0A9X4L7W6_9STAP|nr:esterase-like activity of phytase family protein [Staphylococcus equorum]MDG0842698.1 esterase-like activity of phytase family protein [Staphylococcus equorum]MDG0858171.1 esterase-like activity of phytase family protein [Staphylococcus equorum]
MKPMHKALITSMFTLFISSTTLHSEIVATEKDNSSRTVDHLKLIDTKILPYDKTYKGTKVGGLSGITYDPKNDKWLLISDDRSEHNSARFYEADIDYNNNQFNNFKFKDVHKLKQPNGKDYINKEQYKDDENNIVADPESIRFDPLNNEILYTSEGDRSLGLNPFIRKATKDGKHVAEISIKDTIKMDTQNKKGFRNNQAIEGSTFSQDGNSLWTSMEGPLLQDGEKPTFESGALTRITQYDREGSILSEFAYPLDAIPKKPGKDKQADNGITEILAINDHEFFTLERASVQAEDGSFSNYVRIYKIDVSKGTDIKDINSLKQTNTKPLNKTLVADLNEQDIGKVDNIEGMTFGKKLPNGNDSLVLTADNNFNETQQSQIIAFEVKPEKK